MKTRFLRAAAWAAGAMLLVAGSCHKGSSSGGPPGAGSGPADITIPVLTVVSPANPVVNATTSPAIITGNASDNASLKEVRWSNDSAGGNGLAAGTTNWTATVWLQPGPNQITISAVDASGNTTSRSLTVLLRLSNLVTWGYNQLGQIGDGTQYTRTKPVFVPDLPGVVQAAGGDQHSLALTSDGSVWSWGSNANLQLGTVFPPTDRPLPEKITSIPANQAVAVAAGASHSLVLMADGTVWAFGKNLKGQLGNGGIAGGASAQTVKTAVATPLTRIIAIAAGGAHSLALSSDGNVWAWGDHASGQLGVGAPTTTRVFATSLGMAGVRAISAGGAFSVALLHDGTFQTWGSNDRGQLGTDPLITPSRSLPGVGPSLPIGNAAVSVAAGFDHVVLADGSGTVRAWGSNDRGQLGNGFQTDSFAIVTPSIQPATSVKAVAAGQSWSMALSGNGTVFTCGVGFSGQLGNGTNGQSLTYGSIGGTGFIRAIAAGTNHGFAVACDSPLQGFGDNNRGALGNGSSGFRNAPTPVPGITTATAIDAGDGHALALLSNGTLQAWGMNDQGQLGDNTLTDALSPVTVLDGAGVSPLGTASRVQAVAAGGQHSIALLMDGTVWAWGDNSQGQLGNGLAPADSPLPVQVTGLPPAGRTVTAIAAGQHFNLALLDNGTVYSWGRNVEGELGIGSFSASSPVPVPVAGGLTNVTALACGWNHVLALLGTGTVKSWGYNGQGQLGMGPGGNVNLPVDVSVLTNVSAIGAGALHSLAVQDGEAWAWGNNGQGQLGIGNNQNKDVPKQVFILSNITRVAGGLGHSLALRSDQTVFAWGENGFGQLGDRSVSPTVVANDVFGMPGGVEISAGFDFSMTLLSDGSIRMWGNNSNGQLGIGTATFSSDPVVVGSLGSVLSQAGGGGVGLALVADGTARGWGSNDLGMVGDGSSLDRFLPVPVVNVGTTTPTSGLRQLTVGDQHCAALRSDGRVLTWGDNGAGQLGDGSATGQKNNPTLIPGMGNAPGVIEVSAGSDFSIALQADGTMLGWGTNGSGQLSTGIVADPATFPQPMTGGPVGAKAIAAGGAHTLRLLASGVVQVCGDNSWGELANGTIGVPSSSAAFLNVTFGTPAKVKAVKGGNGHSLALMDDGTLWAWGRNANGQLGIGSLVDTSTPARVETSPGTPLANVVAISAGQAHSIAVTADGSVWAWGWNQFGQLGDGTTTDRTRPVLLSTIGNATGCAAGNFFSLVRQ